jgi:hypothetical protein
MSSIADRLFHARRRSFVGRVHECDLFRSALAATDLPFLVMHISGPGGVGKTTLLHEYAAITRETGAIPLMIDARNVEPTSEAFLLALCLALGIDPRRSPIEAIQQQPYRYVILVDTCELLTPLEGWLRDWFLPRLPERVLTVLAGRVPPALAWRSDPGWQSLVRTISLRNLTPDEGRVYLAQRHVPQVEVKEVLAFTHSYPLALSLVADLYDQRQDFHFTPADAPDVIQALLATFLQQAPGPAHRAALEACALIRVTTESLLSTLLMLPDAHDLFEWLRSLSFIQSRPDGLFPHDITRDVVAADLRWRNPDWYAELHRRARACYARQMQQTQGMEQQRTLFDFVYLHRDNPAVRPFFEWQSSGHTLTDRLRDSDGDALTAMVARHEGAESARLARHWIARQPDRTIVFRDAEGQPAGFMTLLALELADVRDLALDPAMALAHDFLDRHAPLRPGETATYFRFWMAAEGYQAVSSVQSLIFLTMVRHYFTPSLAYTFYPCADPDFWRPAFASAELERLPELDFRIGDRQFGVYGHDWRVMPPMVWLDLMGQREISSAPETIKPPTPATRLIVLSQEAFVGAVEEALRDYVRPDILRNNPLLRSRVVQNQAGSTASEPERVEALRILLKTAADQLQQSPKETRYYRAVYHTCFQPAPTQEQTSELLNVPFSSYRRHLKAGMLRIAEILWQTEIGGAEHMSS